ncbi:unnamed protein product (macronuclear) [Paramecium tetraurelia]|uniref:Uncharacterized protein n=1 Tax=Paramecium tetraurelia TaxID=5888 RepID=A0CKD7_PARTE|nr:uncharacterized protein GSPATT00000967001 [Paramecium tetraurelia]CAK71254.1 unnamed protein product [Paramecium tetraurelia]|eukprot:XP_001438651.1 hypothetical protein (macronuclear) [Paramecium tetraurelia strain d4-2]
MDSKDVIFIIEKSQDFSIFNGKNSSSSIIPNQKDQELMNTISFLQSELNETKANYQQLFKDFQLYQQKSEELLQKQSQYLLKDQQLQSDQKDQIKSLQNQIDQLIQRKKETSEINNENVQFLEQLQNQQQQIEKLQEERDQLHDLKKSQQEIIEQQRSKFQVQESQIQELKQSVQDLQGALEKRKQDYDLLELQMKSEKEQEIKFHLQSIAKRIIEQLNKIKNQYQTWEQQKILRKELAQHLLEIFNQNLRQPLKACELTFRHEFQDNMINGFDEIQKKKIQ